jgi:hypothetical protein
MLITFQDVILRFLDSESEPGKTRIPRTDSSIIAVAFGKT